MTLQRQYFILTCCWAAIEAPIIVLVLPSPGVRMIRCDENALNVVSRLRRKMTQDTIMSGSHRSMAVILIAMGIWHENEAVVEDGQFSVDIKLEGIPQKVSYAVHVVRAAMQMSTIQRDCTSNEGIPQKVSYAVLVVRAAMQMSTIQTDCTSIEGIPQKVSYAVLVVRAAMQMSTIQTDCTSIEG